MKKGITILIYLIITVLIVVGCNSKSDVIGLNIYEIALKEAKKITYEQGYTLKSETESNLLIDDSNVFELIKNASIEGGYSEKDFNSITENVIVVGYELEKNSKFKDIPVMLCLIIDEGKVIGAFLNYSGYTPGIAPIDYKGDLK